MPVTGERGIIMESKEVEIKKLSPIVETVWGVFLLVLSCVLIVFGA